MYSVCGQELLIPKMAVTNKQFVKEVEKYPELYDFTHPSYSRKDDVERAWAAVGRKFNLSGPLCKEKWRNLRNTFVKNLKPPVGSKRRRKYYLSDVMQFTLPFLKAQGWSKEILPEITKCESLATFTPSPGNHTDADAPAVSDDLEIHVESHLLPAPHSTSTSSTSASEPCRVPPRPVTKEATTSVDADKNIAEYLEKYLDEARRSAIENVTQNSEAIKMFLLSLIPDLVALSPSQLRTFKRRTLALIEDLSNAGTAEKMSPCSQLEAVLVSERSTRLLEEECQ